MREWREMSDATSDSTEDNITPGIKIALSLGDNERNQLTQNVPESSVGARLTEFVKRSAETDNLPHTRVFFTSVHTPKRVNIRKRVENSEVSSLNSNSDSLRVISANRAVLPEPGSP